MRSRKYKLCIVILAYEKQKYQAKGLNSNDKNGKEYALMFAGLLGQYYDNLIT